MIKKLLFSIFIFFISTSSIAMDKNTFDIEAIIKNKKLKIETLDCCNNNWLHYVAVAYNLIDHKKYKQIVDFVFDEAERKNILRNLLLQKNNFGETPLILTCKLGAIYMFDKILVTLGKDMPKYAYIVDNSKMAPIHHALSKNNLEIFCGLVISAGIKVKKNIHDKRFINNNNPFMRVVKYAIDERVKAQKMNILHVAVENHDYEVIPKLLHYMYIDSVDSLGQTPLYYAVKNQDLTLITYLIDHNANPFKLTNNFDSPYNLAKNNKSSLKHIVQTFEKHSKNNLKSYQNDSEFDYERIRPFYEESENYGITENFDTIPEPKDLQNP